MRTNRSVYQNERLALQAAQYTSGLMYRSGFAATKIDITGSAGFNAHIELESQVLHILQL